MRLLSLFMLFAVFAKSEVAIKKNKIATLKFKGKTRVVTKEEIDQILLIYGFDINTLNANQKDELYKAMCTQLASAFAAEVEGFEKQAILEKKYSQKYKEMIDNALKSFLSQMIIEEIKSSVTSAELNEEYTKMLKNKRYSHELMVIEVKDERSFYKALEAIEKGSFEAVAKAVSLHSSKDNGGKLGMQDINAVFRSFGQNAYLEICKVKEGGISNPIKTNSGSVWMFKVVKRSEQPYPAFHLVKEPLTQQIAVGKLAKMAKNVEIIMELGKE